MSRFNQITWTNEQRHHSSIKPTMLSLFIEFLFYVFSPGSPLTPASPRVDYILHSRTTIFYFLKACIILVLSSILPVKLQFCNEFYNDFNPLNPELNPICYLLALLAHQFLHVSRIRVKSLTLRLLMSYIYIYIYIYICGAPILDVSRSHTTTQHSR